MPLFVTLALSEAMRGVEGLRFRVCTSGLEV